MAYDPNDPADKKIVEKLIKDAVDAREAEIVAEHQEDVKGLKAKNTELLAKIRKGEGDPEALATLEAQLEENKNALKEATKSLKQAQRLNEELKTGLDTESKFAQELLIDSNLTSELVAAKIAPEFMPAVKALVKPQLQIKVEGDKRTVVSGDKSLGDYIKAWSQGDDGKIYVAAPINGGGGANGGPRGNGQNGKIMTRSAYDAAISNGNHSGMAEFMKQGGQLTDD